jgi:hypothetical protein
MPAILMNGHTNHLTTISGDTWDNYKSKSLF